MAACNRLRKMGPVCRLQGCARTLGGSPWPPPSCGRFGSGPGSLPWLRSGPVLRCLGLSLFSWSAHFWIHPLVLCAFFVVWHIFTCCTIIPAKYNHYGTSGVPVCGVPSLKFLFCMFILWLGWNDFSVGMLTTFSHRALVTLWENVVCHRIYRLVLTFVSEFVRS